MVVKKEGIELNVCLYIRMNNVKAAKAFGKWRLKLGSSNALMNSRGRSDKQQGALSQYSQLTIYHTIVLFNLSVHQPG